MRTNEEFAQYVDAVLLKPFTTQEEMDAFLGNCVKYNVKAACIQPCWWKYTSEKLKGTGVEIVGGIGSLVGATTTETKVFEAKDSIKNGCTEFDMIMNIGWMLAGRYADVEYDIREVVKACGGNVSKVIIETCYLTDEEKREAVRICKRAGATFVKTSTGSGPKGATLEDVKLMVKEAGDGILVKASGGIKTRALAEQFLDAGCKRIGVSNPQNYFSADGVNNESYFDSSFNKK